MSKPNIKTPNLDDYVSRHLHSVVCQKDFTTSKPCTCGADKAARELKTLKLQVADLDLALRIAAACNYVANKSGKEIWNIDSPFQNKINELVGKPPYGDKDE